MSRSASGLRGVYICRFIILISHVASGGDTSHGEYPSLTQTVNVSDCLSSDHVSAVGDTQLHGQNDISEQHTTEMWGGSVARCSSAAMRGSRHGRSFYTPK